MDELSEAWHKHIEEIPGHPRAASEGGTATYDINLAYTYIRCSTCSWDYELPDKEEK